MTTTPPNDPWDGQERRLADKRLALAVAEVRDLRLAAADLAEAVRVRASEFQNVVRQIAILLAIALVISVGVSTWQVGRLTSELAAGQRTITCLLLVGTEGRTAQTLVDCQGR
jgi:hypothetical protein